MRYLLGLFWMSIALNGAVTLRFSGSHVLVDDVYVNGRGPYRFLLDTGAESTSVSPELADRLGLVMDYRVQVVTLNGSRHTCATKANITLGNAAAREAEVLVQDLSRAQSLDPLVVGVLGQSFLGRFRHRIDFRARTLTFAEDPALFLGKRLSLERLDGGFAIWEGRRRLILDSGAGMLTLFGDVPPDFRHHRDAVLGTTTGSRKVPVGELSALRIGEALLRNVPVAVAGAQDREADGLLPLALFRSVYIDPLEGWVILNPRRAVR